MTTSRTWAVANLTITGRGRVCTSAPGTRRPSRWLVTTSALTMGGVTPIVSFTMDSSLPVVSSPVSDSGIPKNRRLIRREYCSSWSRSASHEDNLASRAAIYLSFFSNRSLSCDIFQLMCPVYQWEALGWAHGVTSGQLLRLTKVLQTWPAGRLLLVQFLWCPKRCLLSV